MMRNEDFYKQAAQAYIHLRESTRVYDAVLRKNLVPLADIQKVRGYHVSGEINYKNGHLFVGLVQVPDCIVRNDQGKIAALARQNAQKYHAEKRKEKRTSLRRAISDEMEELTRVQARLDYHKSELRLLENTELRRRKKALSKKLAKIRFETPSEADGLDARRLKSIINEIEAQLKETK